MQLLSKMHNPNVPIWLDEMRRDDHCIDRIIQCTRIYNDMGSFKTKVIVKHSYG